MQYDGTWSVSGDNLVFTPDPNVNLEGHYEGIEYRIKDTEGYASTAYASIEYPQ